MSVAEIKKAKTKQQDKLRTEKRIKAGVCIVCGKRPAMEGIQKCKTCRDIYRKRHNLVVSDRAYFGVCIKCGKEDEHTIAVLEKGLEQGKIRGARCKECNKKNWERIKKAKEKKKLLQ